MGLPRSGKARYDNTYDHPRACNLIDKAIKYVQIPELCSRDLIAVSMETPSGIGRQEVIYASAYKSRDSMVLFAEEVKSLVER